MRNNRHPGQGLRGLGLCDLGLCDWRLRDWGRPGQALFLLALLGGFCGCQVDEPSAEGLSVRKVVPDSGPGNGTAKDPQRLFLNSRVAVFFTQDLDPLSVTSDTLRLVKLTGEPGVVKLRSVTVHRRSVILEPEPPITPALDDGSLQPDQFYRLEIAGLPRTNTVTSLEGKPLTKRRFRYFRTVKADARETDLPHPFLPVGTPNQPFRLRGRVVAAGGKLRLHFTLPVLPKSARPEAFEVYRYRRGVDKLDEANKPPPVALSSARILTLPRPVDPHPGSTVELTFVDPQAVGEHDQVWVCLERKGGVLDYRGRPATGPATASPLRVEAHVGPKPALLRLRPDKPFGFEPVAPDRLSFECRGKWIQPLARREAGDGSLGVFHPRASMTLRPGQPFELGNGQTVVTGTAFNFQAIHIPKGVTVTVSSRRRIQLRASGAVRIDGVLKLEVPAAEQRPRPMDLRRPATVCDYAPVTLIAAGSVRVTGSIVGPGETALGVGSPLAILATGIDLRGRIPFQTILAAPKRADVTGAAQDPAVVELSMEPGLLAETRLEAEAFTEWRRLPTDFAGKVVARAEGVEGDLVVFLQVTAADPVDPRRPYLDPRSLLRPLKLPLRQPVQVPRGAYVRFLLQAPMVGGAALPRLRALVVVAE